MIRLFGTVAEIHEENILLVKYLVSPLYKLDVEKEEIYSFYSKISEKFLICSFYGPSLNYFYFSTILIIKNQSLVVCLQIKETLQFFYVHVY